MNNCDKLFGCNLECGTSVNPDCRYYKMTNIPKQTDNKQKLVLKIEGKGKCQQMNA